VVAKRQLQRFNNFAYKFTIETRHVLRSKREELFMSEKNKTVTTTPNLERALVSNFIRLCEAEGVDSENASRELEMRLGALSELKLQREMNIS
jgi:hypothetical protein